MKGRPKGTKETADREQPWIITCPDCQGGGCKECKSLGYINTKNKKNYEKGK